MNKTIAERVRDGSTFLDANVVGWVDRIDLDRLNIASIFGDCVACQATRTALYPSAVKALGLSESDVPSLIDFGFSLNGACMDDSVIESRALTAEWRRVILARRSEQANPEIVSLDAAITLLGRNHV